LFLFLIILLFICALLYMLFRKANVSYPLSRTLSLLLMFMVLAAACLGQNYSQSLIPGSSDGIAVSNYLAYVIMGEDDWSIERFKSYFDAAVSASLISMVLYIAALLWESRQNGNN